MNTNLDDSRIEALYSRIQNLIHNAQNNIARSINTEMVTAYWLIGKAIVEEEQNGADRAKYGTHLINVLAKKLSNDFGKGFGLTTIKYIRIFYMTYANKNVMPVSSTIRHSVSDDFANLQITPRFNQNLSWTHYRTLCKVQNDNARSFYEIEAANNRWTARELERQIVSMLFERVKNNSETDPSILAEIGQKISVPADIIKDPFVLEFLGFPESHKLVESKLEDALITHLRTFLLELGKGFAFVARQQRLTLDGDHFYIDLVFYHTILKCYVLIDLKTKKLTHGDLGQMLMYVNYYDIECLKPEDNPTIGLVLCAEKNDAVVKYALGDRASQIFASKYQFHLPSISELEKELRRELEQLSEPEYA